MGLKLNKKLLDIFKTTKTTSDEHSYTCSYLNPILDGLTGYSLYSNDSGTTGSVTLSDSASNYEYIEIFYRNVDNIYSSVRVKNPNSKLVGLICPVSFVGGSGNRALFALHSRIVSISGTSIATHSITNNGNYYSAFAFWENGSPTVEKTNYIYITKVIGYK
jgi:hypothetical protein